MATQIQSLTGLKRLRPDNTAALRARLALLPQKLAAQQQREYQDEQIAQGKQGLAIDKQNQQFAQSMAKKNLAQQERAEQVGFGLEAGKMGLNLAQRGGGATFGSLASGAKNLFKGGVNKSVEGANLVPQTGGTGVLSKLNIGSSIGSGLAGFGAAKLIGGKSKIKKGLAGAAAGGLLGLLSGGGGGALTNMLSGGAFGGLGGLFG